MSGIFTIPPDISFVESLARQLWKEAAGDPMKLAGMVVFLPTRRACRTLREAFLRETGGKAAILPRMSSLGDIDETELLFSSLANETADPAIPPPISPLRRRMLLARLVLGKEKGMPFDQAAQLAAALADLLDQAQTAGIDFANLQKLVPAELSAHWQETVKFLEIVTGKWPAILKEEKCMDPAERRNLVIARQAEVWLRHPPPHPVIAAGSTASVPAVAGLLAVIAGMPTGRVVLPGLDPDLDEEAWREIDESHPQYNMKKWLELAGAKREDVKIWPGAVSEREPRLRLLRESMRPPETTLAWRDLDSSSIPEDAVAGLSLLELEHEQEEAEVIALRIRAALEQPGKTVSLVTPDRALAERVAAALRRWNIEANDSGGFPLLFSPLGSFLRDALQAAAPHASAIDYLALLKHPLAACGLEPARCRANARHMEKEIWRGVSLAGGWQGAVRALVEKKAEKNLVGFAEQLAEWFDPVTLDWDLTLPLEKRLEKHLALAERLAASQNETGGERLWRGEEGEAAAAFFEEWRQAARGMPHVSGEDYARLFAVLMREIVVRPSYGQHPRVSILGPLEARLHHADIVILGGMNEGSWPPAAAVDPWMSRPMKRDFGLPLPELRLGLSAHDFVQQAGAPEVLLTRARRVDGVPMVPSRFLLQIEAVLRALGYHGNHKNALAPREPWREWSKQLDAPERISPCKPPEPRPPVEVRPASLSATEVGTWMRNPYAIYASHILKLKPLDDIDAEVSAADKGIMIHKALEIFLARHKDIWPEDPLSELLVIGHDTFAPFDDRPQVKAFWWPRFKRIAEWFVLREADRRAAGISVLAVEQEGSFVLPGSGFVLKGRADRIDLLPGGQAEIIDYKTGALPKEGDIKAGYEPQLPLLGLLAESGCFGKLGHLKSGLLSYWQLKGSSRKQDEVVKEFKGDTGTHIELARKRLESLVSAFADPLKPYCAVPRPRFSPKYDDYAHLARRAEWGVASGGET